MQAAGFPLSSVRRKRKRDGARDISLPFKLSMLLTTGAVLLFCIHSFSIVDANAVKDPNKKWPNAIVPYKLQSNISAEFRTLLASVISEIQEKTCVQFVPKTDQANWVLIWNLTGICGSKVGKLPDPGKSDIVFGNGCGFNNHDLSHELMHTIGFYHEHVRTDRDYYITVAKENIKEAFFVSDFQKMTSAEATNLNTLYDIGSVMHYQSYEFAKNPLKQAIESIPKGKKLGNPNGFSPYDFLKINLLYECTTNGGPKPQGGWCSDTNLLCPTWVSYGECGRNPTWMRQNCKKSCSQCSGR